MVSLLKHVGSGGHNSAEEANSGDDRDVAAVQGPVHELLENAGLLVTVRRVPQGVHLLQVLILDHGGLEVGEKVKPVLAVVATHAAVAHAAKGKGGDGGLNQGVVGDRRAGGGVGEDLLDAVRISAEDVEGQGLLAVIDKDNGLVRIVDVENRENRPKDLLLHGGGISSDASEDGGGDIEVSLVSLAANGDLVLLQQASNPLEVIGIDDAAVRVGLLRVLTKVLLDSGGNLGHELLLHGAGAEHVVWGNAGLARVDKAAPGNPPASNDRVSIVQHNRGALATELQAHRGEVLGGRGQDDLAHGAVSGVHDEIKLLLQQLGGLSNGAVDDAVEILVEILGEQLAEELGAVGGDLRGLDDDGVSTGHGGNHGEEGELDRVVPGTDNEDHTVGIATELAAVHGVDEGHTGLLGRSPGVKVRDHLGDLGGDHRSFHDLELVLGLPEVLVHRGGEGIEVLRHQAVQTAELLLAVLGGVGLTRPEALSEVGNNLGCEKERRGKIERER